jgi:uncharacterized protein (DUF2461 family)
VVFFCGDCGRTVHPKLHTGVDEIETQYTDNVLNYVKELSSKGYHIWLSSRRNLKDKLKAPFGEFIMDMEEVNEEQQKSYIGNRLQKT